jgi:hypothetical protein
MIAANAKMTAGLAAAILLAGATGCAGPTSQIVSGHTELPPGESSAGFLDRVSSQPTVSQNDAMRGIVLLLDGKDEAESFQHRLARLKGRRILPDTGSFGAQRPLTNGLLAYMVYQACKPPGGLTLALFGPSERYCLKELQYRSFMPPGVAYGKVTGMEFVAVLNRAEAYLATGQVPEVMAAGQGQ